ncbi:hypothetical protein LCGC14_1855090 [marine sediment metagenome]|uniref:Uncharacterized protein n=1 Tax=marine sediment metagenome TaxID=412755 RepID=A0A0F9INS7_9ZZZZ
MINPQDFNKVVHAFDFEVVKEAMDALNWNYTGQLVTIEELKTMAWTLYKGVDTWNNHERTSTSSGGFTIIKHHGARYLTLQFNIEEASTQYEGEDEDA